MSSADLTSYNSTACATDGCGGIATHRFESGGVGSIYCPDCIGKIAAISSRPQPSPSSADISDAEVEAALVAWFADEASNLTDAPPTDLERWRADMRAALEAAAATRRAQSAVVGDGLAYAVKGLDMIHNGLMDPTRPRQAVGEVCAHFLVGRPDTREHPAGYPLRLIQSSSCQDNKHYQLPIGLALP